MYIARVIGNVWATRKHAALSGCTLLLVKPMDAEGRPSGPAALAVEGGQGAGPGDTVLVVDEGGSARKIIGRPSAPVRTVIAGVVDKVYDFAREKKR